MGRDIIQLLRNLSPDVLELNRELLSGATTPAPAPARTSNISSERELQQAILDWYAAQIQLRNLADCDVLMAIPNGQYRPGQRPEPGMRPGVPDLFLPVARRGYYGLWLELKWGQNRPTPEQEAWLARLQKLNHCCAVVRSLEEAQELLSWYMGWSQSP
jgi:hypothetical protein